MEIRNQENLLDQEHYAVVHTGSSLFNFTGNYSAYKIAFHKGKKKSWNSGYAILDSRRAFCVEWEGRSVLSFSEQQSLYDCFTSLVLA